jgi:hypothetical protein
MVAEMTAPPLPGLAEHLQRTNAVLLVKAGIC